MEFAEEKAELRRGMREIRKGIGEDARKQAAQDLAQRLCSLPAVKHARTVGVYSACGSELSLAPAIAALQQASPSIVIAYPLVISDEALAFVRFDEGDDRSVLDFPSVHVTNIARERVVPQQDIELLLVPGLAFDEHGRRLGQGGGYYDRAIPHLASNAMTIGIAFDEQIVDAVPCAAHDQRVDYVLTPTRLITA